MFSLTLHPMQPPEITLAECSKRFGERLALRKATLTVAAGETVVVLGPNGAGKSTLLRLVAGLLRPTAGSARIGDVEAIAAPKEVRAGLAYAGHQPQLYRGLTARENIDLHLRLHQTMADTSALLERVGLADRADERIDGFSRGMLQRLALARATAHDPVLLLLDEPASGLDADGRVTFARSTGGQRTIDAADLRDLLRERAPQTGVSARNQLEGTVVSVEKDGLMAKVELACGPYRMVSIITREAVEELDLKPGDTATAIVKSTSVEIRR